MTYARKDHNTGKIGFIILIFIGVGIILGGYRELSWTWNLLVIPIGFLVAFLGYKNLKKTQRIITELSFQEEGLSIQYANGESKEFGKEKVSYSILVKKFIQPVRAIKIQEKGKVGFLNGKTVGELRISNWPELENIAKQFIQEKYERKRWPFGWTIGELLMIVAMLFGTTENMAEQYIGEMNSDLPRILGEAGDIIDEEEQKRRKSHLESEKRFMDSTEKSE